MFLLLSRIPSGLDPLRERFEAHVKKAGIDSVERAVGSSATTAPTAPTNGDAAAAGTGAGANGGSKEKEKKDVAVEPKAYVESLLVVHRKNNELVGKAFRGDQGFVASLDRVSLPLSLSLSLL
jgi:cullin 1